MRVRGVSLMFMGVCIVPRAPFFVPMEPAAIVPFLAIEVVNPALVDVGECPVIEEVAALPVPAVEAGARIAKAIVHTAVIAHAETPIAPMPQIGAIYEAPISGSKR